MMLYLLKSAGCLALLLFFYHFILEKEKMHNFNRFYLLGSILFSFLVPLATITINTVNEPIITTETYSVPIIINNSFAPIEIIEEPFNYAQLAIGIYFLISFIFLIRFSKNLFKIIRKIKLNEQLNYKNSKLILVDDKILPHTFLKYIFINKNEYLKGKIEEELFTHELTHVTQKHTIDVLFIELLQIVFWINPLFIFLKKAIQLNHEFLADERVINQHKNTFQYQHLLLNKAAWNNEYYLASNLNYSLTKKRLLMMTTQSSHTKIWLKKLAVIPLLTGFVFLFAERVEAQETIKTTYAQEPSKQKKLTNEEIFKNLTTIRKDKNGKKITKKYSELTKEEKARLAPPPSIITKRKVPTQKLIEDLKDGKKYAIWINGKVVKNDILNNYKSSDFSSYFVSFVYKNARSKRFPQEYQANLDTQTYFESQNKKKQKEFEEYLKINNSNSTLEEYNTLAKKYNLIPIKKRIINLSDLNKLESLYEQLSEKEKEYAQSFPECYLPNQKINNKNVTKHYEVKLYEYIYEKYEKERSLKPHYIKSNDIRKKNIDFIFSKLGSMYSKLSKEDKKKVKRPIHPYHPYLRLMKNNKVFYKLGSELTKEDELLIPPPPPVPNASKEQLLKAKKELIAWKKRTGNDYPIPPPPPPKNHLDEVIRMAKKGANFYYEEKSISSDKAIDMLKKNKKLSIHSESTNNSNYKVWISKTPIKN